ncbi:hypothetical protein GE061_009158, partial [Apolygus lucorum]
DLDPKKFASPADYAVETAYHKVLDVAERVAQDINRADVIIGADTVVTLDGKLYGKPADSEEAKKYLEELSGRQHTVYTGVVIKTPTLQSNFRKNPRNYGLFERGCDSRIYTDGERAHGEILTKWPPSDWNSPLLCCQLPSEGIAIEIGQT